MVSALAFFFLLTSYYIIRPVRDQLGGAVGSTQLPLFYLATFVAMLLLTPVFGIWVVRFPRRRLLGWSYSFFIICLLGFIPAFLAQDRIGARALGVVFFIWVSVFNLFVVSLFWSFMADVFDSRRAREVFSLIALGGMAGAIFGPSITSVLVGLIGVAPLLLVSAAMLGMSLVLLLRISVQRAEGGSAEQPVGGSLWAGIRELWSRPFLRWMAILMLLGDGVGTLAYALVADYTKVHLTSAAERTAFYAHIDLAVNLLGALLQLTLSPWLLMRRGAIWALVLPQLVNLGLLIMVMVGGHAQLSVLGYSVPLLALMMVGTRGFMYGMTKPASDALYTRVPRETRYKGKNFVETAVWRFGDVVITSSISGLVKLGIGVGSIALIGVGASSLAAWIARKAATSPDLAPETKAGKGQQRTGNESLA
ncbi:NTP/NDP exchange transporter [Dyella nitratireducens]|uniref:MFS transporter n=1 Tax=Dyella nitratireducens TaxID=1849580 RepID=A0ABQ1FQC0_9GAMM|nr:MFS transporter [Dyella nitratireducens]GGA25327.1 MFS transporter [Dyella nitratireducens]GLQ43704.1 MFS transporter [Dyella nitratireducens]